MTKFIMPIFIVVISVVIFSVFTNPIYGDISALRTQAASYNEALSNSKALESQRDKLTSQYNAINPDNLVKLQKLLPENVDNVRLILEIGQIAAPYGMTLKNVTYDASTDSKTTDTSASAAVQPGTPTQVQSGDYGVFNLGFSTSGSYDNFINFTKDLESNLRIVDISSITFSSEASPNLNIKTGLPTPEIYSYDFKIRTYWLKN